MPAKSVAQQKFMAWQEHNPAQAAADGKSVDMTHQQLHDYVATPTDGLPKKKSKKRQYYGE